MIGFREEEVSDVAGAGMEEEVEVAQLVLLLLQSRRTPWRRIEGEKGGLGECVCCLRVNLKAIVRKGGGWIGTQWKLTTQLWWLPSICWHETDKSMHT